MGEIVGAGVRVKPGARVDEAALKAFLATRLAKFKIPERIWLRTTELPRGGTGKLGRRALRSECLAALQAKGMLQSERELSSAGHHAIHVGRPGMVVGVDN